MEAITKSDFINVFREKGISLFTFGDVRKIFGLSINTTAILLGRLKDKKIVEPLVKGMYVFRLAKETPGDFEVANFIYTPSYVSLESALSYYGIVDQFPYQVTSITPRKTKNFEVGAKTFSYAHIKPKFFCDYRREGGFLIAEPKKAVFDFLYLVSKGAGGRGNIGLLRLDEDIAGLKGLREYIKNLTDERFFRFCQNQGVI